MSDETAMWVIYDHPTDFPDVWVARKWVLLDDMDGYRPTSDIQTATKLDTLRAEMVAQGYVCLARSPEDTPNIVEAWL